MEPNAYHSDGSSGTRIAVARVALPPAEDRVVLGRDLDTNRRVTVTPGQLCSGCYILGVQGMGKSSLLEQIACQLLGRDESVLVFDPHGQLIDNIVSRMPPHRLGDTYHLDLKDRDNPFSLNVFACANPDEHSTSRVRWNRSTLPLRASEWLGGSGKDRSQIIWSCRIHSRPFLAHRRGS